MLFFKNNKNSLPQQVSENSKRIETLEAYVKQSYYTRHDYGDTILPTPWAVDLTSTDIPQDTPIGAFSGFLISKDSKLFSIISIQYEYDQNAVPYKVVNADYVCEIKGEKGDTGNTGPTGPQGPQGPAGIAGDQIYVAEYVAPTPSGVGAIANIPWSTTTVPVDIDNVPDSIILVGNGWFYHIDGYTASADPTGYDLVCSAVADVKGPQGETGPAGQDGRDGTDGTIIYSTPILDFTPPQAGSTFTVPIESTNIPSNTPVGNIDGLLLNGSASMYNNLEVLLVSGAKNVKGYFVTNEKGPKGDTGNTGLGYRYETVDFSGEEWVADTTTLTGYNYKMFGYISDVTSTTYVDVKFSYEDIMKFVYAPVCISTTDGVYIYSTTNTETPTDVGALIYEEG